MTGGGPATRVAAIPAKPSRSGRHAPQRFLACRHLSTNTNCDGLLTVVCGGCVLRAACVQAPAAQLAAATPSTVGSEPSGPPLGTPMATSPNLAPHASPADDMPSGSPPRAPSPPSASTSPTAHRHGSHSFAHAGGAAVPSSPSRDRRLLVEALLQRRHHSGTAGAADDSSPSAAGSTRSVGGEGATPWHTMSFKSLKKLRKALTSMRRGGAGAGPSAAAGPRPETPPAPRRRAAGAATADADAAPGAALSPAVTGGSSSMLLLSATDVLVRVDTTSKALPSTTAAAAAAASGGSATPGLLPTPPPASAAADVGEPLADNQGPSTSGRPGQLLPGLPLQQQHEPERPAEPAARPAVSALHAAGRARRSVQVSAPGSCSPHTSSRAILDRTVTPHARGGPKRPPLAPAGDSGHSRSRLRSSTNDGVARQPSPSAAAAAALEAAPTAAAQVPLNLAKLHLAQLHAGHPQFLRLDSPRTRAPALLYRQVCDWGRAGACFSPLLAVSAAAAAAPEAAAAAAAAAWHVGSAMRHGVRVMPGDGRDVKCVQQAV